MSTVRVGDTVHYRAHFTGVCLAAIVTDNTDPEFATVVAFSRDGDPVTVYPQYDQHGALVDADGDTWPTEVGFTPGTWHHIH